MVLSLVYSSLVSISNGIKDGTIQNPHMLPPKLRQRLLDTVLRRRLINEPNCMALLSSVEFLNGMESFSTEAGNYELELLELLETSMATMLPNGGTVGVGITKLNLSVYGCRNDWRQLGVMKASTYPMVARLIAHCPNTTSLALFGIESRLVLTGQNSASRGIISPWFSSVLNKHDVCYSVMENLLNLSIRDWNVVLSSDWPMITFKRLTTLKLDKCSMQFDIWPKFLSKIPTLVNLHMIDVNGFEKCGENGKYYCRNHVDASGLDWVLPFPMPNLRWLEVVSPNRHVFECNKAFVDNLIGCKEIRRVQLMLDQKSTDKESMERLASMNIDLTVRVKVRFYDDDKIDDALDSSSRFKIVRIFHERIDWFELRVFFRWMPEFTTALQDGIDSCSNLTTFGLHIPDKSYYDATEIEPVEMERINEALVEFFGTPDRAMLLKDLRLCGNFDESAILAVFQCCLDLNRLKISDCPAVRDQHLIDWVSNGGGKLKHLRVSCCPNVTIEGIIPILVKSSEGLLLIDVYPNQVNGEGRNWKTMLSNLCPNAKSW